MSKSDKPSEWGEWAEVATTMEKVAAAIRARIAAPQATVPDENERRTIETMRAGETRYFGADTMWAGLDKRLWLNPAAPGSREPTTGWNMRVSRQNDGYHVWPGKHEYLPTSRPMTFSLSPPQGRYPYEGVGVPVARTH